MAKDLAREIGYIYIDSGAMYRAVTLYSLQKGFFSEKGIDTEALKTAMPDIHISFRLNPETQRPMTFLNDTNVEDAIRSMEVSSHVSPIAALGFVREALVKQQQEMGKVHAGKVQLVGYPVFGIDPLLHTGLRFAPSDRLSPLSGNDYQPDRAVENHRW